MDVARSTLVYWESNTYSMNGLSIYVHFHRLWLRAFVWFICSRFSFGMSSAFFLFFFSLSFLSPSLSLFLSLSIYLYFHLVIVVVVVPVLFPYHLILFYFILFYLASQCGITMHLQWSMSLLLYTLTLINADTLKHKLSWGNGFVLNIDTLHAWKCQRCCVYLNSLCVCVTMYRTDRYQYNCWFETKSNGKVKRVLQLVVNIYSSLSSKSFILCACIGRLSVWKFAASHPHHCRGTDLMMINGEYLCGNHNEQSIQLKSKPFWEHV